MHDNASWAVENAFWTARLEQECLDSTDHATALQVVTHTHTRTYVQSRAILYPALMDNKPCIHIHSTCTIGGSAVWSMFYEVKAGVV